MGAPNQKDVTHHQLILDLFKIEKIWPGYFELITSESESMYRSGGRYKHPFVRVVKDNNEQFLFTIYDGVKWIDDNGMKLL